MRRIERFNRGRDPELLARKYQRMAQGPFGFFRGTCHLFYGDWSEHGKINQAPLAWICGDLHLENFGVFKGENRLPHFDLNDFDEAVLAPCTWELARCVTSIWLAAAQTGLAKPAARHLTEVFLESYRAALLEGKPGWLERATAQGVVRELIDQAARRDRRDFLDRRTEMHNGRRRIRLDGERALPASRAARAKVRRFMQGFGRAQGQRQFFEVIDVARRVAGTGSLGVERYVVLVGGKGSPDQNHLIDLKFALPSAPGRNLPAALRRRQPRWRNEAERVVAVQKRVQAASPAYLTAIEIEGRAFVLRELQPLEDRLDLRQLAIESEFESALQTMGKVTAWAQLRSGGRQGSAIADDWIAFARKGTWIKRVARYSRDYLDVVERDWREFKTALPSPAT
jgi:uncharacterized protein (DUF2252 family)